MRMFLAGGGTGGPTTPLLAVAEELASLEPKTQFFFVGSKKKIDEQFFSSVNVSVKYLKLSSGKWRRYFSVLNFFDLFKTAYAFFKSLYLFKRYKPDVVLGAGSFIQVPLAWAAYFLSIPVVIHQQDLVILLSTRLAAPAARAITVTFDLSAKELPSSSGLFKLSSSKKVVVTGNPIRRGVLKGSKEIAIKNFALRTDMPTVLVMGGATGSSVLNSAISASLPELLKYVQVIHVTGGRVSEEISLPGYHSFKFLGHDLAHAYAAADLVISRGGMSTISELSALGKPSVLVPLHGAQEANVRYLAFGKAAVGVLEEHLDAGFIVSLVRKILWTQDIQKTLRESIGAVMPHDGAKKIAKLIMKIYDDSRTE